MHLRSLTVAMLGALGCLALFANVAAAATLAVPINPMSIPQGTYANWNTLYPNPQIDSSKCKFVDIGLANAVATHNIHIPGTTKNLFFEYPYSGEPLKHDWSIGVMTNTANPSDWTPLHTPESLFCAGHTVTADGTIIIAGGYNQKIVGPSYAKITYLQGLTGARVFDPATSSTNYVATMADPRWYPLLIRLPDETIAIIGGLKAIGNRGAGSNKIEIWDPKQPVNSTLKVIPMDTSYFNAFLQKPSYPFAWVLPTGHVFMYGDALSCIWNPSTGKCLTMPDPTDATKTVLVSPPPRPNGHNSNYPWTAGAVMTPLVPTSSNHVYHAEFVIFGGSRKDDHPKFVASGYTDWFDDVWDTHAIASRVSHRIMITWSRASSTAPWTFTFGNWTEEDMGQPRLMGDAVLLPNDDVLLINGAQAGVAGWSRAINTSTTAQEPMSNLPNFWASLYQLNKGANNRYTLLCGSTTPRMYHSTATLTVDGNVLIAGSDRPASLMDSGVSWWPTPTAVPEPPRYNMELFQTPYMFDTANKPAILSVNGGADLSAGIGYNTKFTLNYGPAPGASNVAVTSVVLAGTSSSTHSFNSNQRVIKMLWTQVSPGVLTVTTPLDPFIAPSGWYMLFVNNGKTYSSAVWVKLVDSTGLGKIVPKP